MLGKNLFEYFIVLSKRLLILEISQPVCSLKILFQCLYVQFLKFCLLPSDFIIILFESKELKYWRTDPTTIFED